MNNLEVVKSELLKQFSLPTVKSFLQWIQQEQPDLMALIERDPHKAVVKLSQILRIVTEA